MSGPAKSRRIAIGIDLGTTNSAIAWADYSPGLAQIRPRLHPVRQLVALGEIQARDMLPSALYLKADCEFNAESVSLPWDAQDAPIVGELARRLGPRVPTRFVLSAKSWLCHDRIERTAPVLPWGAPPETAKISPVEASRRVLEHLRQSFDADARLGDLADLPIVLTVPASFDEAARRLTVDAAKQAGLGNKLTLLEEPQAAFYAWIADHPGKWQDQLRAGETILVCDVGGGTTDFTLIAAIEDESGPGFERVAVGDHLMLGGDNMDLALAHLVEGRLGQRLSVDQWTSLRAQSRAAKEKLLGNDAPESVPVGITGKGSRVVGGSMSATVTREEVLKTILEGFFPVCRLNDQPQQAGRSGFQEFGLPFEQDAAVTRHLAAFLARIPADQLPSAILFNGGALKPAIIRDRIIEVLRNFLAEAGRDRESLRVLETPDLDLAVARGAAYYAAVRQGGAGLRMRSGLARSIYVGFGAESAESKWLCVVPRNAQEGDPYAVPGPNLQLLAGRKVAFPLATSSIRPMDQVGELLEPGAPGLRLMPPLEAEIKVGRKAKAEQVPVRLEAQVNAIGTVDLWCVSVSDPRKWMLEIGVRQNVARESDNETDLSNTTGVMDQPESGGVLDSNLLERANDAIAIAFSQPRAEAEGGAQRLVKTLEEIFEADRAEWPASACRSVFDSLKLVAEERRKSPAHEARWLNLIGYALRPGGGQPGDDLRMKFAWSLFSMNPVFSKENHVWVEWWVNWRRIAAGLSRAQQEEVWRRLQSVITGSGKKPDRKIASQEFLEMVRTAASLERLSPQMKLQLGNALILKLQQEPEQAATYLWALGRIASRQPLYGPVSGVIPAASVESWVNESIKFEPKSKREIASLKLALLMSARKENDRSLDLPENIRAKVAAKLQSLECTDDEIKPILEFQPIGSGLSEQALGETLPLGLVVGFGNREL